MKYLLTFFIILFFSCKGETTNKKEPLTQVGEYKIENLKAHKLDFIGGKLLLPQNYQLAGLEKYKTYLKGLKSNSKYDSKTIDELIQMLDRLRSNFSGMKLFSSQENQDNIVIAHPIEHIELDKESGSFHLGQLEKEIKARYDGTALKFERLDSKFVTTTQAAIIKFTYKLERKGFVSYRTEYIISSKYKTFKAIVVNGENEDFYELIKRITFGKLN